MKKHPLFKKISTAFVVAIGTTSLSLQAAIFITPKKPSIDAAAYIVMDYNSGAIIAENNLYKERSPASLTKLMTAYVVFQFIKDGRVSLEDDVKISKKAWKTMGSKSFVEVGRTIPLKTLLQGMIIQSGNDASVALAEHIAVSEGTFAAYMNEYASEVGMKNTHFENASGLDYKNQHTTAFDMAKLATAIIRNFPQFYPWFSKKEFTYHGIKQPNRNKLLWLDKSVDGLKTGYTDKAKYNLVASAKRADMRLVSVVLGSTGTKARTAQTQRILDYGFRFFETKTIDDINTKIPIAGATKDEISVGLKESAIITLPRGQLKLSKQVIELNANLHAPISAGDSIGHLIIKFKDKDIAKLPLIALEDAPEAGFFSKIWNWIMSLFSF